MAYDFMDAIERAKKIKLVVLDVHGVLTNGVILYNEEGVKFQSFHHDDGFGANALMMLGVEIALMSRKSKAVEPRAAEIGIKRIVNAKDKTARLKELLAEMNLQPEEACFVGDELIDINVMKHVGFAVSPANGAPEVKDISHHVTKRAGGEGMLRELAEFILRSQGKWHGLVEKVSSKGWG